MNCATLNNALLIVSFLSFRINKNQISHTLHLNISGPSKPKGLFFSGSHFISYSLVRTVLVNHSLEEKWNSKAKP